MNNDLVKLFFKSCLLVALFGCQPSEVAHVNLDKPVCLSSQSECTVNTVVGTFAVSFNQTAPKAENPFEIHIEHSGEQTLNGVSGYLEGVDMFMGKIPLFFTKKETRDNGNSVFIAQAMFGSCSLKTMKWKAIFIADVQYNGKTKEQLFNVTFTSTRD